MIVGEGNTKTYPALDWHGIWPGYVSYDEDGHYFPQDLPRGLKPVSYTHLTLPTTPYV